jgi:DNA-directed RNA polymerase specialized sigma subunit
VAHSKLEQLEQAEGRPIREILQELFQKHGSQTQVAKVIGISQSTLSYHLLKLNLEQRTVLVEREFS